MTRYNRQGHYLVCTTCDTEAGIAGGGTEGGGLNGLGGAFISPSIPTVGGLILPDKGLLNDIWRCLEV